MSTQTSEALKPEERSQLQRVVAASMAGTIVEWYEFFLYAAAATLVFNKVLFPESDNPFDAIIAAFVTYAVGFIARPLGGVVFGHFGDKHGRKKLLQLSIILVGASTFLMGCIPTFEAIGYVAPVMLVLLRFVQGFAVGGEWGGATLMAVEHASADRRGFYGAFPQMGAPAGTASATLAFFLASQLPDAQFLAWGWRLPFLFSAALIVIGLVIRLKLTESPEFAAVVQNSAVRRMPIVEAFRRHWRQIVLVAGAYLSQGVFAYICVAYLVSYATTAAGIDRTAALFGVFVAALVAVAAYPAFGAWSDVVGRKRLFLVGVALMAASVFPVFALIDTGSALLFGVALVLVFGLAMAPAAGVTGALFSLAFDADVRYSGVSIGYTLSQVLGSAFAPTIAAALYAAAQSSDSIAWYLVAVSAISVVAGTLLPSDRSAPEAAVVKG